MSELLRTKCRGRGTLIITDTSIRLERGQWKVQEMPRNPRPSVDAVVAVARFLGLGGHVNLTFRGAGTQVMVAEWVKPDVAKEIMGILRA